MAFVKVLCSCISAINMKSEESDTKARLGGLLDNPVQDGFPHTLSLKSFMYAQLPNHYAGSFWIPNVWNRGVGLRT